MKFKDEVSPGFYTDNYGSIVYVSKSVPYNVHIPSYSYEHFGIKIIYSIVFYTTGINFIFLRPLEVSNAMKILYEDV